MKWSVFDIVGPIMVGPSSSHTSGAVRLGLFANKLIGGVPDEAEIYLHGSYAEVYKGHGTDKALVAGLLGIAPDSERVVKSFKIAKEKHMRYKLIPTDLGSQYHPNTAKFVLKKGDTKMEIIGQSIGAGSIEICEINGIEVHAMDGKADTIVIWQSDKPGVVADISNALSQANINIAEMSTTRSEKNGYAMTIITTDSTIDKKVVEVLSNLNNIKWVRTVPKLD